MRIVCIGPSDRARRIGELESVRIELLRHPVDAEPYHEELASIEAELLALLREEPA
jgi:hypothetical protein